MATPRVIRAPPEIGYRDLYARWRLEKRLAKIYQSEPEKLDENFVGQPNLATAEPGSLPKLPDFKPSKEVPSEMKVCIIGSGAAGLFTAMIFDYLMENKETPGLNISYDIYEAAGEERLGGRLYTYKFPSTGEYKSGPHDYYDVGAMRFPDNPIMTRTFELFELLEMHKRDAKNPRGLLIPYNLTGKNCPTYFNDIRYVGGEPKPDPDPKVKYDPYGFNVKGDSPVQEAGVPEQILRDGPGKTINKVLAAYRKAFKDDPVKGWNMLLDADKYSSRDFLMLPPLGEYKTVQGSDVLKKDLQSEEDTNPIGGPGFNFNTVEWLENFEGGTRWYQQAFSEMVLENLDFNYPGDDPTDDGRKNTGDLEAEPSDWEWYCIEGGANILAQRMEQSIKHKPKYNSPVTSIKLEEEDTTHNMTVGLSEGIIPQKYAAIFNSATLGSMQRMDLSGAKLNYGTKRAIRILDYGASCKVGIRFKYAWWIYSQGQNIYDGGQGKTDLPIRVCVYPSYNLKDGEDQPAVLLCSYTWEQDASRMGSLISKNSPEGEGELKRILFHNLALLHSTKETYKEVYKTIKDSYITHHAYNWYHDPYASGAFAFFGPSQFKSVWPDITTPSAGGKLIAIGEATSTHHAWVVGALESAVRGVYQFLCRYAEVYPPYKTAMEFMIKNKEGPFGPLPYGMTSETAKQQVIISQTMLKKGG